MRNFGVKFLSEIQATQGPASDLYEKTKIS